MAAAGRRAAPTLKDIIELGVPTMALLAAHQRGLLAATLERAATAAEFARALGLDDTVTRLTLDVLVTCGALVCDDGRYGASPALVAQARDAPGGVALHLSLLAHLPELLATGVPLMAMDGTLAERGDYFAQVAPGLGHMYPAAAAELAAAVDGDTVLDLGAGSGVWSLAFALRAPQTQVTAVDLPQVLAGLRGNAAKLGVQAQVETIAGSYFQVALPAKGYAVVILGNVLHLETPENAALLVRKAVAALRPGGTLAVIDILGTGEYESDPVRSMYALFLAARTRHGRMYPRPAVLRWLVAAGLDEVRQLELPSAPSHCDCLLGRRAVEMADSPPQERHVHG
jgi:ubiquinone/menaquinone biosynthesis C-methylase UbiE